MTKKQLLAAATLGIMVGACASKTQSSGSTASPEVAKKGECHGVNACKGKGECGGKGHGCAGKNECKGKGWIKMTETDCKAKKGTFKG